MKKKRKAYIAPVVIACLLCAYYIGFACLVCSAAGIALWVKLLGALVPLVLAGAVIAVLVQRIRELKSGESDDLDKY